MGCFPLPLWVLLAVLAGGAATIHAQPAAGILTGMVRSAGGNPVGDVAVTTLDPRTGVARTTRSNADGVYTLSGLPPGVYIVSAEVAGFQPIVRENVRVETGRSGRLDFVLTLGAAVQVSADASLPRRESATVGAVIDERRITELPLNGRNFVSLAALTPGVALPPGSLLPRINGGRPRVNEYLFDGISVLQPEPGQVAFFPVVDAIQEFTIETNSPPAEFGRFNGGVVNLTTKAGSNVLAGTAFGFLRHEQLNARNFFAASQAQKPRFRRNQFGGVVGGPLRQDRTFFFLDYQGQRQSIERTVISTVPTVLQRQGRFTEPIGGRIPAIYDPSTGGAARLPFPDNLIAAERIDPVARTLLERYPLPTSPGTANNYRRTNVESVDQDQFDVRIDHAFASQPDRAFVRVSHFRERFTPVAPLPDGSGLASGALGPQDTRSSSVVLNYQSAALGRLLNDLRIGDTRRAVRRTAVRLGGTPASVLGLSGIPASGHFADTLPTFQIAGYQQLGSPANTGSDFSTEVIHVANSLTWQHGRHTFKAGADLRWQKLDVLQPPSPTGVFQFTNLFTDLPGVPNTGASLASFLLGQVQTFSIDLQQDPIRNRAHVQEYFVQDSWKVADGWTFMPGVRYTLNFPSVEAQNQAAVFSLTTEALEFLGREGRPPSARRLEKMNFGPRLGIAGALSERTVVSSGYAVIWIEQAGITTPFTTPAFPFLQTVSERTLDNVTPPFVLSAGPAVTPLALSSAAGLGQGVFAVDRDHGSGYVQQWNAALRRQLPAGVSLELAYVGSTIRRLGVPDTNLNQLTVEQLALGPALLERVPNPYFGAIPASSSLGDPTLPLAQLLKPYPRFTTVSLYRHNVGTSTYHGITARLERRGAQSLSYTLSYSRSRLVDDGSSVFDASILTGPVANYPVADSFDRRRERDYSAGDIPHVLAASVVWDVPVGRGRALPWTGFGGAALRDWTLTSIVTLQSGTPVAITQSTNFNAFAGFGTQRPNLVGVPTLPASERDPRRWFNTAAFVEAPRFTLGTSSRNPVRGPAYRSVDVALIRRVPVGDVTVEARAEAFNVLNTASLRNPNGVLGAPNFGTITTAGDPRVVQLALKVLF